MNLCLLLQIQWSSRKARAGDTIVGDCSCTVVYELDISSDTSKVSHLSLRTICHWRCNTPHFWLSRLINSAWKIFFLYCWFAKDRIWLWFVLYSDEMMGVVQLMQLKVHCYHHSRSSVFFVIHISSNLYTFMIIHQFYQFSFWRISAHDSHGMNCWWLSFSCITVLFFSLMFYEIKFISSVACLWNIVRWVRSYLQMGLFVTLEKREKGACSSL